MVTFLTSICQRIQISEIREHEWFKEGYSAVKNPIPQNEDEDLDDISKAFHDPEVTSLHCSLLSSNEVRKHI